VARNLAKPVGMGFRFLDLAVSDLRDAPQVQQQVQQNTPSDGTLMLKYVHARGMGRGGCLPRSPHAGGESGQCRRAAAGRHRNCALPSCHLVGSSDDVSCRQRSRRATCHRARGGTSDGLARQQMVSRPARAPVGRVTDGYRRFCLIAAADEQRPLGSHAPQSGEYLTLGQRVDCT